MSKNRAPHRKWTNEEKPGIVKLRLDEHLSILQIGREKGVHYFLILKWVKTFPGDGEDAPEPQ